MSRPQKRKERPVPPAEEPFAGMLPGQEAEGGGLSGLEEFFDFVDDFRASPEFLKREKEKARVLRNSPWWKNRRASGKCHYCGRTFPPGELTMDHLVPLARGGQSTKGNIVPCCKECNTKKRSLLPVEWQEYLAHLSGETPPPPTPEGDSHD